MGRLAVSVTGAAIGSFFGAPQIGWLVGSALGSALFPTPGTRTTREGPRLNELVVSGSSYGAPIPRLYGSCRLSGNMIWSSGLEEVRNETTETVRTGKGGGGSRSNTTTYVSYDYFSSFAMAFCEGPQEDVRRIWADGKIIYDRSSGADYVNMEGLVIRFYPGSESQFPDPLISSRVGAANSPAYRGLCYIVFDRMPLRDFGNRVPNITVELSGSLKDVYPTVVVPPTTTDMVITKTPIVFPDFADFYFNTRFSREDQTIVHISRADGYSSGNRVFRYIQINARNYQTIDDRVIRVDGYSGYNLVDPVPSEENFLFFQLDEFFPSDEFAFLRYGLQTGSIDFFNQFDNPKMDFYYTGRTSNGTIYLSGAGFDSTDEFGLFFVYRVGSGGIFFTADVRFLEYYPNNGGRRIFDHIEGNHSDGLEYFVIIENFTPGDPSRALGFEVFRVRITNSGTVQSSFIRTFLNTDIGISANFTKISISSFNYDRTDGGLIVFLSCRENSGFTDATYVVKFDSNFGGLRWSTRLPGVDFSEVSISKNSPVQDSRLYFFCYYDSGFSTEESIIIMDTGNGSIIYNGSVRDFGLPASVDFSNFFSSVYSYELGKMLILSFDSEIWEIEFFVVQPGFTIVDGTVNPVGGESLGNIVRSECVKSGLKNLDVVTTDLDPIPVTGYLIGRQTSARSVIEQLATFFSFEPVETEYRLEFSLKSDNSVVRSLAEEDLVREDYVLSETRIQDVELPKRITVTYMDLSRAYDQQAHSASRSSFVKGVDAEVNLPFPLALSPSQSKQGAERLLMAAWSERLSYNLRTSWENIDLETSDVIQISTNDGATFTVRLSQIDVGSDLSMELNGMSYRGSQYSSNAVADGGSGFSIDVVQIDNTTKTIFLFAPLLDDIGDTGRSSSRVFFLLGGFGQEGWSGATIFSSLDGTDYSAKAVSGSEMTWGYCQNALGPTSTPFQTDRENSLVVFLNTNQDVGLSSVTDLQLLNGANAAAVLISETEVEIIQFRDATENPDGSYTLSNLLRGRRGTEIYANSHALGEVFVLLNESTVKTFTESLSQVGSETFYRTVPDGSLLESSAVVPRTNPGNDLKPYSPVHLKQTSGSLGSDVALSWIRRTRVGGDVFDGLEFVPLSEDSEVYTVEILNDEGSVIRTFSGVTSNSITYTALQQTDDLPETAYEFRVAQVSAQVGNGHWSETKRIT